MNQLRGTPEQRLDLVVAGTRDAVMMVESEAYELTEEEMLGAVLFAHEQVQPVIDLIVALAEDAAKEPFDFQPPDYAVLYDAVKAAGERRCAPPTPFSTSRNAPQRSRPRRKSDLRATLRGPAGGSKPRRRFEEA